MHDWIEGALRMLRLRRADPPDDDEAERKQLRLAALRLKRLDIQADIIARRAGKTHE